MAQKIDHLETIAQAKIGGSWWSLATNSRLSHVMTPEFFLRFEDYPLRKHDRISLTASFSEPKPEYAVLVVTDVDKGKVATELWLTGSDVQL